MKFEYYNILWHILWVIPLGIFLSTWAYRASVRAMEKFAHKPLIPKISPPHKPREMAFRMAFTLFAVLFLILSLARPQWGFHWQDIEKEGLDITFAVDTSRSMLAEDFFPNRLEFAKDAIENFVGTLKGDRVALIAFSGSAFLMCPLTTDHPGFLLSLEVLNEDSVPRGGTAIAEAIDEAVKSYEGSFSLNRILIIVSDGEDHAGNVEESAKKARDAGIIICAIGVGSPEGTTIPIYNENTGTVEYVRDRSGEKVVTRLNESVLKTAAEITGGIYVRAEEEEFGLNVISENKLVFLEPQETETSRIKVYTERFRIPLAVAAIFLLFEIFYPFSGKPRPRTRGDLQEERF